MKPIGHRLTKPVFVVNELITLFAQQFDRLLNLGLAVANSKIAPYYPTQLSNAGGKDQMDSSTSGFMIVYFIYGLAFFSLGIALLLESQRTPSLALSRRLIPLSVFGIVHGIHEWLEYFVIISTMAGMPRSASLEWLRLLLLIVSFASLFAFGVQELQPAFQVYYSDPLIVGLVLVFYTIALLFLQLNVEVGSVQWFKNSDALTRMLIAVPASLLSFFTLNKRARNLRSESRHVLARFLRAASYGFVIYSFTQIFVPNASILYAPWINADGFHGFIGLPIQVPRALVALLLAYSLIGATQTVERERQEELITAQEARISASEQTRLEITKRKEIQQTLLRSIVDAQEVERSRISRELHDETAQLLSALGLEIAAVDKMLPESDGMRENIRRIQEICREISGNIIRLVHQLRPAKLDDLGILQALHFLVDEVQKNLGLTVTLAIHGNKDELSSAVETVIYRVAQESLTNTARHASTDSAQIVCTFLDNVIQLEVSDQGIGFEPNLPFVGKRRIGFLSMRERVEAVGGTFAVESSPDKGTTVSVEIPRMVTTEVI